MSLSDKIKVLVAALDADDNLPPAAKSLFHKCFDDESLRTGWLVTEKFTPQEIDGMNLLHKNGFLTIKERDEQFLAYGLPDCVFVEGAPCP